MFFSPLIQKMLKKNKNITQQDKDFVAWSIKLGYFNIFLLLLTIVLQVVFYLTKLSITQTISTVTMIVLAISLVIWSIYAISGKSILKSSNKINKDLLKTSDTDLTNNKLETLINYIPLYNIYLRYKNHNFNNPDIILKESILRWSLFAIIFITVQSPTVNWIILSILWIRIIALMNGIDLSNTAKQKINKLFTKNPEELRWYISWTITNLFNKKTISENITTQKTNYELLFKSTNKQIIFEYTILDLLIIWWIYTWYITNNTALIAAILFIAARYLIMLIKRNHLPHIPVIREITSIFFKQKRK
jgi:hypothetical protein